MRFVLVAFERFQHERPALQIDLDDVVGDDSRAEVERLLPHQLHQLRAGDGMFVLDAVHVLEPVGLDRRFQKLLQVAAGKAGVVFDFGRERELAQRQRAGQPVLFRDRAFEHQRLQFGPRRVDGGRPTGRSAADDDHMFCHNRLLFVKRSLMGRIIECRGRPTARLLANCRAS